MTTSWDLDDWFVALLVAGAWVASTVFLFLHHSDLNFATWATFGATIVGVYHFLSVRDDKEKDTCSPS
jgi:hypothetical protein